MAAFLYASQCPVFHRLPRVPLNKLLPTKPMNTILLCHRSRRNSARRYPNVSTLTSMNFSQITCTHTLPSHPPRTTSPWLLTPRTPLPLPLYLPSARNAASMAFPPGSKPGMSSCAPPYQSTHLSPQTSSHTRSRFASLAGSLKHQPGLRTTQPFAIWLLRMSLCHGVKWMSSSIMIFWRKRPCPTASIATPMVIAPWVVPLDQSLSSLFVPSHLPQPLPHRHLWHSLQQSPPIPQRAPPASSHLSRLQPLGLPPPQLSLQAYLQQTRLQWKPPWLSVPKSTPIVTPSIPFSPPPPSTPVKVANLSTELKHHPNQQFVTSLLHDLQWGCHVGYTSPCFARITPNLTSALLHPDTVSAALAKEVSNGHTAGPFQTPPIPNLQCSPLGVVPKKDGTWRIIMDLSSPHGSSINDYISKEEFSLHYATFDQALSLVARYGKDALMAKLDIKHAFRLCPVRLEDRELLGIHWQGQYYIDLRLPFGMRSSPYLFNRLADAFEWLLKTNYHIQDLMHYLDDYFTVGPANSLVCAHNVHTITQVASQVGIPLAPNKLEGPTTQLVFLGILIDTTRMETSLPDDKLHELLSELRSWSSCKKCLKRELLSLIGKLNFACRIIPAGRIFLRRLIDLSTQARLPHHHVTMNREARRDISWWLRFLPSWNGRAIIPDPNWTRSPDMELFTDASGSLGYGIFYMGHWIANPWPPVLQNRSIQWKELYHIALACLLWGHQWTGKKLLFHCDNQAVVDIWASGSSRDPLIMHLVRSIFFTAATNHFTVLVTHIVGTSNVIADSLSRLQMSRFRLLAPAADLEPTPVPQSAATLWQPA